MKKSDLWDNVLNLEKETSYTDVATAIYPRTWTVEYVILQTFGHND